jgi:hypothetical protein
MQHMGHGAPSATAWDIPIGKEARDETAAPTPQVC